MKSTEFLKESLGDKSIQALLKAKEILKAKEQEELAAWQRDIEQRFPQLTQKPAAPQGWGQQEPQPEPEKKEELSVLNAKLKMLNAAIEKYAFLEKLKQRLENRGLLTQAMASDSDISMYIPYAYKDGYKGLNDKLDKSIELFKNRLNIHKAAFKEADEDDLEEGWRDAAAAGALALGMMGAPSTSHASISQNAGVAPKAAATFNVLSNNPQMEVLLQKTAKQAGINGTELAQFLAQTKHESWDFSRLKEKGGSLDFRKYDVKYNPQTAKILGNTQVGDGQKFHGRGFIQLTGRDNYRRAGNALNLPLEQNPDLAERPDVAAQIAVWYWQSRVAPYVKNFSDTASVTKRINPALRGLQDRQENFKDYMRLV